MQRPRFTIQKFVEKPCTSANWFGKRNMKVIKSFFVICLAGICLSLTPIPYQKVKFVYDGDTLLLEKRKAMKERRGIWKKKLKGKERIYLGNRNSLRFHRPHCYFGRKISERNLVRFKKIRDAFWEGYCPCGQCNPWRATGYVFSKRDFFLYRCI